MKTPIKALERIAALQSKGFKIPEEIDNYIGQGSGWADRIESVADTCEEMFEIDRKIDASIGDLEKLRSIKNELIKYKTVIDTDASIMHGYREVRLKIEIAKLLPKMSSSWVKKKAKSKARSKAKSKALEDAKDQIKALEKLLEESSLNVGKGS